MRKEVETCCVVEIGCESPANVEELVALRTRCYVCGLKVCKNCSCILTDTFRHKKVRACFDCIEDDLKRFRLERNEFLNLVNGSVNA